MIFFIKHGTMFNMKDTNLIYLFLDSFFTDSTDKENSDFAYNELPEYYLNTFNYNKQKFNTSHFITNKDNNFNSIIEDADFQKLNTIINTKWSRYKRNTFWYNTSIRVILLCIYARNNNLNNVLHIEADNIIFGKDISSFSNVFEPGEFGFCNEAPFSSAPAIIFLKDRDSADNLLQLHIKLYEKGEQSLIPYVGQFGNWITDMALLDIIYRSNKHYKMLPCLPFGSNSINFDQLQCVFDPTSYGQYLGGTNNGHPPGYQEYYHFIGKEIINKNINVVFDKQPFVIYKDIKIPIFNLHVHNKKAINSFLENANC